MNETSKDSATTRSTAMASGGSGRRRGGVRRWTGRVLAGVGVLAIAGLGTGLAVDVSNIDRTRGGYEAPYTGWTGTPIDSRSGGVTANGFRSSGVVMDVALNCTTGMITFHTFGLAVDYRTVSPRAIAVHRPREACTDAGFTPQF